MKSNRLEDKGTNTIFVSGSHGVAARASDSSEWPQNLYRGFKPDLAPLTEATKRGCLSKSEYRKWLVTKRKEETLV